MNDRTHQPYWAFLYGAFLTQTDPAKLNALLEPLEAAIVERIQELADVPEVQNERLALQTATRRLLKIKTTRLDFPPVSGAGMRGNSLRRTE
jgi:hypothetical protein